MSRCAFIFPFVVAAIGGAIPGQEQYARSASPDQHDVFAVLDRLDSRDFSHRPFVKVATGWTLSFSGEPAQNTYRFGFLLESNEQEFVVQLADGNRVRLLGTPAGTPEHHRVGFVPFDFATFVHNHVEVMRRSKTGEVYDQFYMTPRTPVSREWTALYAARTCAKLGLEQELKALWGELPPELRLARGLLGRHGLAAFQFHKDLHARLVLDFGDPTLSWQDHLARLEYLVENSKQDFFRDRWKKMRDDVKAVLGSERLACFERPLAEATVVELVDALVDVCRPIESGGWGSWAAVPFDGRAGQELVDELVGRGINAMPTLIARLEDETPTKSWYYLSRWGGSFQVLPMHENVRVVLHRIVGAEARGTQNDWQGWYERVRDIGLRDYLVEVVGKDEANRSARAAETLLKRFPAEHPTVLDAAESSSGARRLDLLRVVTEWIHGRDERPPPRLLDLFDSLAGHEDLQVRHRAAELQLAVGSNRGARALLPELRAASSTDEMVLPILMRSGDIETWQAIEGRLDDPSMRTAFATAMDGLEQTELLQFATPDDCAEVEQTLRRCLQRLLADGTNVQDRGTVRVGNRIVALHAATVADLAATQLVRWWPRDYAFDPATTRSTRERQIADIRAGRSPTAPPRDEKRAIAIATIATVDFWPAAARLPKQVRERVQQLRGSQPDARTMFAILMEAANEADGHVITFDLERVGRARGYSLRCDFGPDSQRVSEGSRLRVRVTVAGDAVGRGGLSTGGRIDLTRIDEYSPRFLGQVTRAFARPLTEGVEITLRLGQR